jgi:2,3-bisphosphoglycerate-independent phosphoglycerate mutase
VSGYLPKGQGSRRLLDLMKRSEAVLREHPVNQARLASGLEPATTIWLFWGSGKIPEVPPFLEAYGLKAALTSGVDLLRGLAKMMSMSILEIPGVTDGPDNDYRAQTEGAIAALGGHDLVVIHVEAPDEAGHSGSDKAKITAIERIDAEIIGRLRKYPGELRVLVMPDHPTPISVRTHTGDPVPYLLWGTGFKANGARRFTEAEALSTGIFLDEGYKIMSKLVRT